MKKKMLCPNLAMPVVRTNNGTVQGNDLKNGVSPSELWGPVNPTYDDYQSTPTRTTSGTPRSGGQVWGPVNPTYDR